MRRGRLKHGPAIIRRDKAQAETRASHHKEKEGPRAETRASHNYIRRVWCGARREARGASDQATNDDSDDDEKQRRRRKAAKARNPTRPSTERATTTNQRSTRPSNIDHDTRASNDDAPGQRPRHPSEQRRRTGPAIKPPNEGATSEGKRAWCCSTRASRRKSTASKRTRYRIRWF